MNKYSEMSDFEVNKLIAERIINKVDFNISNEMYLDSTVKIVRKEDNLKIYADWIKAYDDSFKLMIDNNISLICREFSNKVEWHASKNGISAFNKNPCRAIAECFLLIKDEERGNEKAQKEV